MLLINRDCQASSRSILSTINPVWTFSALRARIPHANATPAPARMRRSLLATALALLAAPAAFAQAPDSAAATADTAALRALVERVCPGESVIVTLDGRRQEPAPCALLPDGRLLVHLRDARLTPRLVEIGEVWVRER